MVESGSAMRVQPATAFPRKGVGSAEMEVSVGPVDELKNQHHDVLETSCIDGCGSMEVNVMELGDREVAPPCSTATENAPNDRTGSRRVKFNPVVASRLIEIGDTQETCIDQQRAITSQKFLFWLLLTTLTHYSNIMAYNINKIKDGILVTGPLPLRAEGGEWTVLVTIE
jgi:hypothetical protein